MSKTPVGKPAVDASKRTWLITSSCVGAAGAAAVAVPFVSTFQPSERAKAAGAAVEVDISAIKPGEKITVEWRGKPVWIVRRTPEQLATLKKMEAQLADPKSTRKPLGLLAVRQVSTGCPAFIAGRLARRFPLPVPWFHI
jgi:ubiquinol-cytochrome c reductase iron-sulfur subunit